MDRLLPLVISKRHDIAAVVSHRMPLSEADAAYRLFDGRSGGCTKVVMRPW
jgi:S-(hydroxymethyl)glutathione dehydrogenase/alcohol dehydrogenase